MRGSAVFSPCVSPAMTFQHSDAILLATWRDHDGRRHMETEPVLYLAGVIHTMDGSLPRAEALLVRDGRVAAIGARDDIPAAGVRRVDLEEQCIIPGFNDSHCHVFSFGLNLGLLDVSVDM